MSFYMVLCYHDHGSCHDQRLLRPDRPPLNRDLRLHPGTPDGTTFASVETTHVFQMFNHSFLLAPGICINTVKLVKVLIDCNRKVYSAFSFSLLVIRNWLQCLSRLVVTTLHNVPILDCTVYSCMYVCTTCIHGTHNSEFHTCIHI